MGIEGPQKPEDSQEKSADEDLQEKLEAIINQLKDKTIKIGNVSLLRQEVGSLMMELFERAQPKLAPEEDTTGIDEMKYYLNELWQARLLKENEANFYAKALANVPEEDYDEYFFAILKLLSESDLFAKGERIEKEKKEQLEKFDKELQDNIESIAGLSEAEFVEQNAEAFGEGEEGEAIASQMYQEMEYPLRGLESWSESRADEMLEIFQTKIMQGAKSVDSFTNDDGDNVEVFKTKDDGMQVLKITDKDGYVEWLLKPIEADINK